MRSRNAVFAVFASVFSLVVVGGSLWGPRRADSSPLVTAIAMARDVEAGTKLTDDMLVSIRFPASHLPPGVGIDREDFCGRVLNRSVRRDQLLYPSDVAESDSALTLQSKIEPGKRGYSIPLNSPSAGVAGFALPGSLVDVLSSPLSRRGEEVGVSLPVVEGVLVLAVDNATTPEDIPSSPKSITLLLTPQQASKVDQAQSRGPLRLSLRNREDEAPPAESGTSASVISQTSASPSHAPTVVSRMSVMVLRETVPSQTVVRQVRRGRRVQAPVQTVVSLPADR
jgi:pilus assembly protein CpaB